MHLNSSKCTFYGGHIKAPLFSTVFENHRKRSHLQHCERSELVYIFESLRSKSVARQVTFNSSKIGVKCQNFKCDILSNFQTMCAKKLEF